MRIPFRWLTVGALCLGFSTPISAGAPADTSYLKEMPPPARVLAEIRGKDAIDTDARQWGALRQLMTMMSLLSNGRDVANKMTPQETELRLAYRNALPRFNARSSAYEYDDALHQEMLDRFFSPTWRARYAESKARQNERQAEVARLNDANRVQQTALVSQWRREWLAFHGLVAVRFVILPIAVVALFVWPLVGLWLRSSPTTVEPTSPEVYPVDVWGMRYDLKLFSGVVRDKEVWTETQTTTTTHGGDAYLVGGVVHTTPTTRSTSVQSTLYHRYWLRNANGAETWVRFSQDQFPANHGQTVTTAAKESGTWMAYNHGTRQFVTFKNGWRNHHRYHLGTVTRALVLGTGIASFATNATDGWIAVMCLWGLEAFTIKRIVAHRRNRRFERTHLPRLRSLMEAATVEASALAATVP